MNTDVLGRRKRSVSQPTGRSVELTPRVLRVLGALRRHEVLPTPILFDFWRGPDKGYLHNFQEVVGKLFHEEGNGGPFVDRPGELNPDFPNPEPAWYTLTPAGMSIAQADSPYVLPGKRDKLHHRAMGGCIGASLELLAPAHGMEFVSFDELLAHDDCPRSMKDHPTLTVKVRSGALEPDAIFGLRIPGQGTRLYAREDDRGGESFDREDKLQNTIKGKFERYIEAFRRDSFKAALGFPKKPYVLFVTTRPGRIQTIREWLKDQPYADRFLFKAVPTFDTRQWRAPRAPITELFEPWETVGEPKDIRLP